MNSETFKRLTCFFIQCKYRDEESNCTFDGTVVIGTECDCLSMKPIITQTSCSVTEKLGRR